MSSLEKVVGSGNRGPRIADRLPVGVQRVPRRRVRHRRGRARPGEDTVRKAGGHLRARRGRRRHGQGGPGACQHRVLGRTRRCRRRGRPGHRGRSRGAPDQARHLSEARRVGAGQDDLRHEFVDAASQRSHGGHRPTGSLSRTALRERGMDPQHGRDHGHPEDRSGGLPRGGAVRERHRHGSDRAEEGEGGLRAQFPPRAIPECRVRVAGRRNRRAGHDRQDVRIATGAPAGPFQIYDVVGLTTAYNIASAGGAKDKEFAAYLKENYLDKGKLGIATGEGFYSYRRGEPAGPRRPRVRPGSWSASTAPSPRSRPFVAARGSRRRCTPRSRPSRPGVPDGARVHRLFPGRQLSPEDDAHQILSAAIAEAFGDSLPPT